jgi:hypothetical protein
MTPEESMSIANGSPTLRLSTNPTSQVGQSFAAARISVAVVSGYLFHACKNGRLSRKGVTAKPRACAGDAMYGDLQGIAGKAFHEIEAFDIPALPALQDSHPSK